MCLFVVAITIATALRSLVMVSKAESIVLQALTLGLWVQWPGGPVDLKTYWSPKKLTGPPKNELVPTSKPNLRDEKLFA